MYERLSLGELKPTKMVLQLVDHHYRLSKGMVEDVLIKVEKFIFSIGFIILETEVVMSPEKEMSIILGQPFLATLIGLINYRDKKMKLTFETMTMDLNVFNPQK